MSVEIKVPGLPESVTEATVAAWHKKPGERVRRDENLVDLETDKVVLEVPAVADGVLQDVRAEAGRTVTAGQVLAVLATDDGAPAAKASSNGAASPEPQAASVQAPDDPEPVAAPPSVRKLVAEMGLEEAAIPATGKGGRLTREDVLAFAHSQDARSTPSEPASPPTDGKPAQSPAPLLHGRREERVPMTRIRARIAERLKEAQNTAAMLTTFNEVDLKSVSELRSRHKEAFEKQHGVKLGFMSFFVRAAVQALREYPTVNASIDGQDIVYHAYQDIGIAVSTERGLVVPVLRDAQQLSFAAIEKAIVDLGSRARSGKLTMEQLTGGTFSITNGGVFGSMLSTPILNPPQSAILGMHAITDRPMVVDGEIVVRPMMYLALSYDHRLIDGREAVLFLRAIKASLEDPARLLLGL